MRTITLELLRHGTAHGQLLSPLTPYLALCENHPAVTIHLPFEHNQFLHRLSALGYKVDNDTSEIQSRIFQLQDTAKVLSDILAEIPGLTAESNKKGNSEENLTHLRLIISASELALLPFELSYSPDGLPGAGQYLLLQPQMPICLTREIRRISDDRVEIPKKPKILFVAASPPDVGAIPLEAHLLILRRVVSPWVYYYDENDPESRRQKVEEHLHFLPGASIEAIEEACATNNYTHIHILAHGVEQKENYDTRFRLALHNAFDPNKTDYVSGSQLATALRAARRTDNLGLSLPFVVTLASCDSGNVGSVAGAGSSVAHSLHEAGIPMVIANQFPLSFEGSIRLVECLYDGLLWGTDPRLLLNDLRRRLYSQFNNNHDWASLVTYVSLPPEFDTQLEEIKIDRASYSINAALSHADEAIKSLSKKLSVLLDASKSSSTDNKTLVDNALQKITKSKSKLEGLLKRIPRKGAEINGRLASTEKKEAEVLYRASKIDKQNTTLYVKKHIESLRKARDYYWECFMKERTDSWAVVQYVSIELIMQRLKDKNITQNYLASFAVEMDKSSDDNVELIQEHLGSLWSLANLLSHYDLNNKNDQKRAWAHGNLIELNLLSLIMKPQTATKEDKKRIQETERAARMHVDSIIEIAGRHSFEVYSTRRQVLRYIEWFPEIADIGKPAQNLAENIFESFPQDIEVDWTKNWK